MFKQWQAHRLQSQRRSLSTLLTRRPYSRWSTQVYPSQLPLWNWRPYAFSSLVGFGEICHHDSWDTPQSLDANPLACLKCWQQYAVAGDLLSPWCAFSDANPVLFNAYSSHKASNYQARLKVSRESYVRFSRYSLHLHPDVFPQLTHFDLPLTSSHFVSICLIIVAPTSSWT